MLIILLPNGKSFDIADITDDVVTQLHNETDDYVKELIELEIRYEVTLNSCGVNNVSTYRIDDEITDKQASSLAYDLRELVNRYLPQLPGRSTAP